MIILSYKNILRRIVFPVFSIIKDNYYFRDKILFLNGRVIDDRNQPGVSLGIRRMQTPHKLFPLKKSYGEFIDLVRENPPILIDNRGLLFSYTKTETHKVVSYRIKRKEILDTHTRIWIKESNFCFITNHPHYGKDWVQVLHLNNYPWMLYSFSEDKLASFTRKI